MDTLNRSSTAVVLWRTPYESYFAHVSPKAIVLGRTPYEAYFGQNPYVSHFRVFGCDVDVHVPKTKRGKDSKSKKYWISFGYRLYDLEVVDIKFSRVVIFEKILEGSLPSNHLLKSLHFSMILVCAKLGA